MTARVQALQFPSIDILRGFAALSVVVYHVIELFDWKWFPFDGPLVWFRLGWMGVDLFFVISGFVIGLSALSGIEQLGPDGFRQHFMRRRVARIVPLYYLTAVLFVVLVAPRMLFEGVLADAAAHMAFIHNLFPNFHGSIDGANWSLAVEMQFYVLMLWLGPRLARSQDWRIWGVLFLVAWAWRYGCVWYAPVTYGESTTTLFRLTTQLPGTLDEFAVGLLLAKLLRSDRGAALLNKPWWAWLTLALAFYGFLHWLFWRYSTYWNVPVMVVYFRTLLALEFGLFLVLACQLNGRWWLRCTAPLRYLGTISYGIYLWHLLVLLSLRTMPWLGPEAALPYALGATLMLAALSWHAMEKPLLTLYTRRA